MKAPTAGALVRPDFRRNHLLQFLLVFYLALWAALSISPLDRSDWLLENLLVFVFVGGLAVIYRRFPLSDLSYILIALFLALHAVGAHYTYAKVPLGFWLKDAFDLSRNHFDRIVHFSFGLLLGYPIRETLLRVIKTSQRWIFFWRSRSCWRGVACLNYLNRGWRRSSALSSARPILAHRGIIGTRRTIPPPRSSARGRVSLA